MNKETLEKANELQKRKEDIDGFVYSFNNTWKQGFLKRHTQLIIGHKGYGYFTPKEMECDKELSEMMYQTLLEYQEKVNKEFTDLGVSNE